MRADSRSSSAETLPQQYRVLLEIADAITAQPDVSSLLKDLATRLQHVVEADGINIVLYDEERHVMRLHSLASATLPQIELSPELPIEDAPAGWVWENQQPLLMNDLDQLEARYPKIAAEVRAFGIQCAYALPLTSAGRRLGVLGFGSRRANAYGPAEQELLRQVAKLVAVALDNTLNFASARVAGAEAKRRSEELQLLLEINNAVVTQLDLRALARVTATRLRGVLRHDVTGISLYDEATQQFRAYMFDLPENLPPIPEGTLMPLEGTIGGLAFHAGRPVFLERYEAEFLTSEFDRRLMEAGIRSGGVVPLIAHDKKLGFLGVGSFRENAFSAADQELLGHIAKQFALAVENALAFQEIEALKNKLTSEKLYLEDEIRTQSNFEELIGESQTFRRILKQVETVAPTDSTVLIRGETDTGKELIARAIHALSTRRERTIVKINCAAIPTGLLESELFGHEKGAFTGAIAQRIGRFELAHQGTLLLDEVGDIPLELQSKLLRVLQEQELDRLGSTRTQRVNVRLIAATNCDLEQMVAERKYRSDLFYRLNIFPITIPPLRQRREDIPALARFFTQKYARRLKKPITAIRAETMAALTAYHWPGKRARVRAFHRTRRDSDARRRVGSLAGGRMDAGVGTLLALRDSGASTRVRQFGFN